MTYRPTTAIVVASLATAIAGATLPASVLPAMAGETAVAPEMNPPGDIPDQQVFVRYSAPQGYSMKVPEGWARRSTGNGVQFSDKYNTIDLRVAKADQAPTAASVKSQRAAELQKSGRAVDIKAIKNVRLKSGPAVLIAYRANSEPNPVTNRQIRLEHNRYLMFHNGKLVTLDMSAPAGADNVDAWRLMSNSFQWQ